MSTTLRSTGLSGAAAQVGIRSIGGLAYDWVMVALSAVFAGGLYLDGWAHNHGKVDQSFFTPWHAFFYGGFVLTTLALAGAAWINWRRGADWRTRVPAGYAPSLLGAAIFAAGGVGDLIWHTLFGIEESFEALVSPTHLLLGLGLTLIVTGPLRAAWRRTGGQGWRDLAPALLSLSLLISVFTFFMMFSHPLMSIIGGANHPEFRSELGQAVGIVSLLVITVLLLGPVFVAVRRWRLPAGALTLVWGINTVAMAIVGWELDYAVYLTGAMLLAIGCCDWLLQGVQDAGPNTRPLRLFAFAAPTLLFGAYFFALLVTEGSRWSVHLLGGAIVLPGVAGWLLSYVATPPRMPEA